MGTETKIAWTDHTHNVVWGCQRVSPGCEHCYAEAFDKRVGGAHWGPAKTTERRVMGDAYWQKPLAWNKAAARDCVRPRRRVFCSSMADVFEDHPTNNGVRPRLWQLIRDTPNLDWQLLTKRPENIAEMLPDDWGTGYPNVWLGTTVENQEYVDKRVPILLKVPAAVRFLSIEPMLGAVDFRHMPTLTAEVMNAAMRHRPMRTDVNGLPLLPGVLDWAIIGCESGPKRRPFDTDAAIAAVRQLRAGLVPAFVKQVIVDGQVCHDIERFPAGLQVQEFPAVQP